MAVTATPPTDKRGLIIEPDAWPVIREWLAEQDLTVAPIVAGLGQMPRYLVSRKPVLAEYLLSERELQVLAGMAQGRSNVEIGRDLFLSPDTIKSHAKRLFEKLKVHDRAHAVAIGYQRGILGGEA